MTVTATLLRLYLVDQQLRGLSSRLKGAEGYLGSQDKLVGELDAKAAALSSQIRQLEASARNDEVEAQALDERIAMLRERMNKARTSKEHAASLAEVSTLKADKQLIEDRALESLTKLDALRTQLVALDSEREERRQVRVVAAAERDTRSAEIKDRLAELQAERKIAIAQVPPAALTAYEERLALGNEDVMAPVEEQDRRNMEYTCGSCYTHLPIEQVSILLRRGDITKCPSCQAILYMEQSLRDDITTSQQKKNKKSVAVEE